MKVHTSTVLCCGLLAAVAWSQSSVQIGSEPSPMEAFANRQGVRTTWFNEVGRLAHDGTRVVLTALVVEDNSQPARKVRGVKIDMSRPYFWPFHAHDHIYLDEGATERTRTALLEIADAVAEQRIHGNGCMGASEFWPLYDWPWNKYHELNAEVCEDAKSSALVLSGRGKRGSFEFPDGTPTSLAGILSTALDQLKQR